MKKAFYLTIMVVFVFSLCACGIQSGQTKNDSQPASDNYKSATGVASLKELVEICNEYIDNKGDRSIIDSVLDKQMCLAINLEDDLYREDMETAKAKADLILKGADAVQKEDRDLAEYIINAYSDFNGSDGSNLNAALDWLLEEWLYRYDSSWSDYYSSFEYDFKGNEEFIDDNEIRSFDLGSVDDPDGDSYRLDINYEIKNGNYYLISFDCTY